MALAAFFMKAKPPALAGLLLGPAHGHRRIHPHDLPYHQPIE
jgi:hypothetical protein